MTYIISKKEQYGTKSEPKFTLSCETFCGWSLLQISTFAVTREQFNQYEVGDTFSISFTQEGK